MTQKNTLYFAGAIGTCLQWILIRSLGLEFDHPWMALSSGACIFGAAVLLSWAGEVAELDLPQSVSLSLIALITVLPEYAVDMYFAWMAGKNPTYTAYATANMTGANRLLIGLGWPAILLAYWYARGISEIKMSTKNSLELLVLFAATSYSFVLPFKATLSIFDAVALFLLFGFYAYRCAQSEVETSHLEGPAEIIARLPVIHRRVVVIALFLFSAAAICFSAEPFAEAILGLGHHLGIEEFLLVQWLAPLASESPEFIVAIVFAMKGRAEVGLRTLVSAKVNQWTLLVGMLPLVYNISAGHASPMPLDARQVEEILLTSAQSLLGTVILLDLRFSFKEALLLLVLFLGQFFFPQAQTRYAFSGLYIVLAIFMLISGAKRRGHLRDIVSDALRD